MDMAKQGMATTRGMRRAFACTHRADDDDHEEEDIEESE